MRHASAVSFPVGASASAFLLRAGIPALLLWLLAHPYAGIYHDARIYALTAAHWIHPDVYASDLFFKFGSQGDLSVFTSLYGLIVKCIGLDLASRVVTLSGGIAWILALACLSRLLLGEGVLALFAVLLGAASSFSYSPNGSTFVLNENFATARSWAMPLGLFATACIYAGKRRSALFLGLLSSLLHPLIGIWPLTLAVSTWFRRGILLIIAAATVLGTVFVGWLDPSLPGLRLMTGDWIMTLRSSSIDLFVGPWGSSRLDIYLAGLACLFLGYRVGTEKVRAVSARLALIGLAALLVALVVSWWFPVEFLAKAQLWRAFWLVLPVGGIIFLSVLQSLVRQVSHFWILIAASAPVFLMYPAMFAPAVFVSGCALSEGERAARLLRLTALLARFRRILLAGAIIIWLIALPGLVEDWTMAGYESSVPWWRGMESLHGLIVGGAWPLPLALAFALQQRYLGRALIVTTAAATVLLSGQWDRRTQARMAEEQCYLNAGCPAHPFSAMIHPGDAVFWHDMELSIWFRLNATSYVSQLQGTGRLFSERKHYEWARRMRLAEAAQTGANGYAGYAQLCADRSLDWVVSDQKISGFAPELVDGTRYLYSCPTLRAVSPAPT